MKSFLISKVPTALALLAVVAWTWTLATVFFSKSPQPAQAATLSVSVEDSLQVFLVVENARIRLDEDTRLKVGNKFVGYQDKVAPLPLEVEVHNVTSDWLEMRVTGDQSNGVVPIFGNGRQSGSNSAVNLAPRGEPGSGLMGLLDFQFLESAAGQESASIEFATRQIDASEQSPLPTSLGFEDSSLGMLCSFLDIDTRDRDPIVYPIRDEFMESHGVSFQGGHPDDGLAILHECSTGETGLESRGDGDYFLVGNEYAELATGGFAELPLIATFTQPVTQVSLWAAAGVRSGPEALSLTLTTYADAGGSGEVVATASLDATMQWQQLSIEAPENKSFRSVELANASVFHSVLVDDLEWTWAPEEAAAPASCVEGFPEPVPLDTIVSGRLPGPFLLTHERSTVNGTLRFAI